MERQPAGNRTLATGALQYMLQRLRGRRGLLMLGAFGLMLLVGALANAPAILLGRILDDVDEAGATFGDIVPGLVLIAACIIGREAVIWGRKFIVESIGTRVEQEEFVRVISGLLSADLSIMIREKIGALHTRIQRSIEGIIRLIKLLFMDFLPTTVTAVVAVAIAGSRSPIVAAFMIAVGVLGSLVTWCQVSSQKGIRLELFGAKETIGAKVNELLSGIGFVRASGMVSREEEACAQLADGVRSKEMRHHTWMMSYDAMKQLIEGAGYVAVIAFAAWQAGRGVISKGDVLTMAILYVNAAHPLRELHRIVDEGYEAVLKVRELVQLQALPPDLGLAGAATPDSRTRPEAKVVARGLTVRLPSPDGKETVALRDVSVEIPEGQFVGIAGPSGSGKSTLARTLLGLISDYQGSARICDIELRDWNKEALAEWVGYVPQNPFLLAGSVRENVRYGANGVCVEDDALWKALIDAQIAERVKSLPRTLDALISEGGRNLSGGEKQRLALARVFLRDARILVLDEATSALDSTNEARIQEAMLRLAKGRTTLIIAHRLSTLRDVDRILVFDRGRIVQDGPYKDLESVPGLFRDLVERQRHLHLAGELGGPAGSSSP